MLNKLINDYINEINNLTDITGAQTRALKEGKKGLYGALGYKAQTSQKKLKLIIKTAQKNGLYIEFIAGLNRWNTID